MLWDFDKEPTPAVSGSQINIDDKVENAPKSVD